MRSARIFGGLGGVPPRSFVLRILNGPIGSRRLAEAVMQSAERLRLTVQMQTKWET